MESIKIKTGTISVLALFLLSSFRFSNVPVKYFGFFQANQIKVYEKEILAINYYRAEAFLLKTPSQSLNTFYGENLANVIFNDIRLAYETHAHGYFDTIIRNDEHIKWKLNESQSISSFQYSCIASYPVLDDANSIPNEINLNEDLLMNLQNATDFDEIEFIIEDTELHLITPWYRRVPASNQLVIPKNSLSGLIGPDLRIRLILIKNEIANINGKDYKFENRLILIKKAKLVN